MPWADVEFRIEQIDHPAVADLLAAFSDIYANGGPLLRSLQAVDAEEFCRAIQFDPCDTDSLLQTVLASPSVVAGIPELQIQVPLDPTPTFKRTTAFGMEQGLNHLLLLGGAYNRFDTFDRAHNLTQAFMEALFGTDLKSIEASATHIPWTPWFYDIVWDSTFIVSDFQRHRLVLLCCTDTD